MSRFAEPMARLIDELKKLPGVGSNGLFRGGLLRFKVNRIHFGDQHTDDPQPIFLAGSHGGFHVFLKFG